MNEDEFKMPDPTTKSLLPWTQNDANAELCRLLCMLLPTGIRPSKWERERYQEESGDGSLYEVTNYVGQISDTISVTVRVPDDVIY
jgi:hypothetical protein